MPSSRSIASLPAWAMLNGVEFFDISADEIPGRPGDLGLTANSALRRDEETLDIPTLLKVPAKLILSEGAVELYAKVDGNFKLLLDAAGRKVSVPFIAFHSSPFTLHVFGSDQVLT